jgi:hypothetical protein
MESVLQISAHLAHRHLVRRIPATCIDLLELLTGLVSRGDDDQVVGCGYIHLANLFGAEVLKADGDLRRNEGNPDLLVLSMNLHRMTA